MVGAHLRDQPLNYQLIELDARIYQADAHSSNLSFVRPGEHVTSQAEG